MDSLQKLPISVIILTYNEEANIQECLESIYPWAGEIFIVDSGSTDATLTIAEKYTKLFYAHCFENYAAQRNWAQNNLPISNEWIFHLDADERVAGDLAESLSQIFTLSCVEADAFLISRKTIFRNRWIRHGGHYPVYHLRIYRRTLGKCEDRLYDQHFIVSGRTLKLKGDIINVINPDIKQWKKAHKRWAWLEAQEYLLHRKRQNKTERLLAGPLQKRKMYRYRFYYKMPLFIRPLLYFIYRFIFKLGILDGREGLVFHFMQGFWFRFLVDTHIFNMRREKCIF